MHCTRITLPPLTEGGAPLRAIVCGPKPRKHHCKCGAVATLRCDWKVASKKSGTCDAWICERCTTSPAPEKDLCQKHGAIWAKHPSNPGAIRCDYCHQPARYLASSESVYGRDYGPLWRCEPCDAHVGVDRGTRRPLGRLANKALREAKQEAHAAFDPIWEKRWAEKSKADPAYVKGMARGGRYKRLAELLGIPTSECHIGLFDLATCRRVVEICASGALAE